MVGVSDLAQKATEAIKAVAEEVAKPLKAVADAARGAFKPAAQRPAPRKSKGWRKHVRRMKAAQRHS